MAWSSTLQGILCFPGCSLCTRGRAAAADTAAAAADSSTQPRAEQFAARGRLQLGVGGRHNEWQLCAMACTLWFFSPRASHSSPLTSSLMHSPLPAEAAREQQRVRDLQRERKQLTSVCAAHLSVCTVASNSWPFSPRAFLSSHISSFSDEPHAL